jgi:hypothetical protein
MNCMEKAAADLWKGCKFSEALYGAEELEADAGRDDEQAHCEEYKAAQLLPRPKNLPTKVFQHG